MLKSVLELGVLRYFLENSKYLSVWLYGAIAAVILISYLLGSINSAIIVSKLLYRDDIRKHGSGNAGLTNMHRTFGLKAAGLTLLGDMLKTVISIILAMVIFGFGYSRGLCTNPIAYIAGAFAVLGHVYPIYYHFKGGKGVLVTSTMALIVSPLIFLVLLLIFILIVKVSKYISLASVSTAILYPVLLNGYSTIFLHCPPFWTTVLITILLAIFIVWLHRENLKRINERTESKFSFKRKQETPMPITEEEDDEDDE